MSIAVLKRIEELEARIKALEEQLAAKAKPKRG